MGKIKIHELAKELNVSSKEILDVAKKLKIDAKSHLSNIDEEEVNSIKNELKSKNKKEAKIEKNANGPVIIRREVIINDEKSKKSEIKKEEKNNNIGFVERKRNKDFNIVYRNKPNKPKNINELFGIKNSAPKENTIEQEQKVEIKKEQNKEENVKRIETEMNQNNRNNTNIVKKQENLNNEDYKKQKRFDNQINNSKNSNNNKFFNNRNNTGYNNNERNNFNNKSKNFINNGNSKFKQNRPLDEKGIEKNLKDIMSIETPEKETIRDYSKSIDKQKNNSKFDENRKEKKSKSRRNDNNYIDEGKLKSLKQSDRLSNMFDDQEGGMLDFYDLTTQRGRKGKKKIKNGEERNKQKIFQLKEIEIPETITVKDLATEMKKTTAEVIKKLLGYGIMATINQSIDFDTAYLIANEFGITAKKKETITDEDKLFDESEDKEEDLVTRPPVVVVMGHVDHGKTSLLDTIRKTNVIDKEAGGITQAIGAYKVKVKNREITFLDTPGHEAFTAMRARGAQITDIAILVVAANDGIMPQTVEAIHHAKSAGIPIIVAINKIDLPDANVEKVKQELMKYDLVPEEWGGDTICVPISAKKNINIDQLLDMVLLEADVLELKTNPNKQAKGVVIEARLDKSKGAIATMLVQRGKLDVGDTIIVGSSIGRIRAMTNENGKKMKSAGPSTPVEIMGLTDVPEAGDTFYEVKDEKTAKHLIEKRKIEEREKNIHKNTKITLDNLFSQMEEGNIKTLNLIVKADVQGSVEALTQSLEKLKNDEVRVKVIHSAVGAVNESDVTLAKVSNAIVIAFNVRPNQDAKNEAEKDEVEIKQYSVIYQVLEDVEAAMKGMLSPKYEEKVIGTAEVRQIFKISNVGTIAGAFVLTGKVERNAGVRIIRDNIVVHEGKIATLKRFKDDAKEVSKGFECGIQIEDYNDIKEGDTIEAFVMEEIKQ